MMIGALMLASMVVMVWPMTFGIALEMGIAVGLALWRRRAACVVASMGSAAVVAKPRASSVTTILHCEKMLAEKDWRQRHRRKRFTTETRRHGEEKGRGSLRAKNPSPDGRGGSRFIATRSGTLLSASSREYGILSRWGHHGGCDAS